MRRSRASTRPSEWWYSTAPRISSWATAAVVSAWTSIPTAFSTFQIAHCTARITGPNTFTTSRVGAASTRAVSSGRAMARVLGSTSA